MTKDGWAMQHAAWNLRSDRAFVMSAVKLNGWALKSRRALTLGVTVQVRRYPLPDIAAAAFWMDKFDRQNFVAKVRGTSVRKCAAGTF